MPLPPQVLPLTNPCTVLPDVTASKLKVAAPAVVVRRYGKPTVVRRIRMSLPRAAPPLST